MKYFVLVLFGIVSLSLSARSTLDLEVGRTESAYNKVRVPGDDGTRFNLAPALDSETYFRLSFIRRFSSPYGVRFLYAPLAFEGKRSFSKDISFSGQNFPSSSPTKVEYEFNSYRATYFYDWKTEGPWIVRVGGTLKVRDAKIRLESQGVSRSRDDTGLVPLIYFFTEYKWSNGLKAAFDFDGLIAPQGRALDVALLGGYQFLPEISVNLGYRILEGGVDNDKVYNMSQVNYFFTALRWDF